MPGMYPSIDFVSTAEASVPPLFYDYSEDFQQEYLPFTPQPAPTIETLQSKSDNRKSYSDLEASNVVHREQFIAELPADAPSSKRNSGSVSLSKSARFSTHYQSDTGHKGVSHAYSVRDAATRSDTPAFERAEQSSKRSSRVQPEQELAIPGSFSAVDDGGVEMDEVSHNSEAQDSEEDDLREDAGNPNGSASDAEQHPPLIQETTGYRILSSYKRSQEVLGKVPHRTIR